MERPPGVNRRHRKALVRMINDSLICPDLSLCRRVEYWFNDWSLRFGLWECAHIQYEAAGRDRQQPRST